MSSRIYVGFDIPEKESDGLFHYEGETFQYYKNCKNPNCTETFFSTSRGQAYCCPECNKKHVKRKKQRKSVYGVEFKEAARLLSRCYDTAKLMAELYFGPKETWVCEKTGSTDRIEVHHRSLNPLDNRPENLMLLSKEAHAKLHSMLEQAGYKVNMLEVFKEFMKTGSKVLGTPEEIYDIMYSQKVVGIEKVYEEFEKLELSA